jgi:hypothetical protein
MKTKQQIQESSVEVAFAELGRLERDRTEIAAAKRALREAFNQRGHQLASLRERIVAERPKALARIRLQRALRERDLELFSAKLETEAKLAHDERLALIRAELETKRVRLAAIETSGTVPRPGRIVLEWSIPVAAAVLVGILGFTVSSDDAVARAPAPIVADDSDTELVEVDAPVIIPMVEPMPEPVAEPVTEPVAGPSKKPVKKPVKKPRKKSSSAADAIGTNPTRRHTSSASRALKK